jgi:hypothetical protein
MVFPHGYFVETRKISIEAGFEVEESVISLKQTSPASISPLSSCQTLVHFTSTLICRPKHQNQPPMCSSLVPPNASEDGTISYWQEEHASITPRMRS